MYAPANAGEQGLELRWLEEARILVLEQLKAQVGADEPLEDILRTANTSFVVPAVYPGEVLARLWVSRIGTTSFRMHHELLQYGALETTLAQCVRSVELPMLGRPESCPNSIWPEGSPAADGSRKYRWYC